MTPAEISGYWRDRALDDIAADPARWLKTEWNKALALVSRYEAPDNTGYALGAESSWLLALTPVRFALVLPLALAGMLLAWRRRALVSASERSGRRLLLGALLGYACVVLVFCVTARYRMPVIPLLLVYAGSLVGSFRRGDQLTVVFALVVGVALTLAAETFGPLTEQERNQHLAVRYRNRALVALERGDAAAAGTDLERALRAHPGALKVYTDLARLDFGKAARLMATGDTSLMATAAELRARALSRLATALDLGRDSNEIWVAVGLLAYEEGQDAVAVQALDVAVERQPHQRDARQYLVLSLLNVASDPGSESVVRAGLLARAYFHAVKLIDGEPERDDGYGLLALVLVSQGRTEEAAVAVERYDRRAVLREAAGLTRHLPDQPAFASLRSPP
jgi:tetratricopeptide (TPR) repeat protein